MSGFAGAVARARADVADVADIADVAGSALAGAPVASATARSPRSRRTPICSSVILATSSRPSSTTTLSGTARTAPALRILTTASRASARLAAAPSGPSSAAATAAAPRTSARLNARDRIQELLMMSPSQVVRTLFPQTALGGSPSYLRIGAMAGGEYDKYPLARPPLQDLSQRLTRGAAGSGPREAPLPTASADSKT